MRFPEPETRAASTLLFDAQYGSWPPLNVVEDESEWRVRPARDRSRSSEPRAIATRWHGLTKRAEEFGAETADDCHVVKIALRTMNIRLSVSGRVVQDGVALPGMFHITEPAARVRCVFRGPYDALHLHLPNNLIAEYACDTPARQRAALCSQSTPVRDPMVEQLAWALLGANEIGGALGRLYADCISMALVARLLAGTGRAATTARPKVAKLAQWRLRRAVDYIDARLAEAVRLGEVASAAGLSRMHFAAQFKATTGLRPHEYLLRRRIERAQEMLVGTRMSLVDVGLSVGFQTQSHFTSVFRRFVGQPPLAWRESRGNGKIAGRARR